MMNDVLKPDAGAKQAAKAKKLLTVVMPAVQQVKQCFTSVVA